MCCAAGGGHLCGGLCGHPHPRPPALEPGAAVLPGRRRLGAGRERDGRVPPPRVPAALGFHVQCGPFGAVLVLTYISAVLDLRAGTKCLCGRAYERAGLRQTRGECGMGMSWSIRLAFSSNQSGLLCAGGLAQKIHAVVSGLKTTTRHAAWVRRPCVRDRAEACQ